MQANLSFPEIAVACDARDLLFNCTTRNGAVVYQVFSKTALEQTSGSSKPEFEAFTLAEIQQWLNPSEEQ